MFLYTNKAFMADLGSNFVVHLLTLQVHLILEPLHFYLDLYINVKIHFKITNLP